ncbi:DUF485 domain-containing protein [Bacillus sp. EB600]|uniref:DUF485 domain-containing protein n=1 Tax=Bacillus sp. EB600 TaxID=2806345 RepID=UPI00210ECC3C|nr:DUF485 domain-containing protein [Bacillus sp. EB600]MCQ6280297.1 DUF485 domain-containing protein [Bacillus sp. EB600]
MATNENALKGSDPIQETAPIDYSKIVQSSTFQQLLCEKRNFIIPWSIFFLVFYFALPILTAYSSVLNKIAFGSISWAWVFGSAQFIMTWALCIIYTKRAAKFDQTVDTIKQSVTKGGV